MPWCQEAMKDVVSCDKPRGADRKSTRLNSSHLEISYAVFCLKKTHLTHQHRFAAVSLDVSATAQDQHPLERPRQVRHRWQQTVSVGARPQRADGCHVT